MAGIADIEFFRGLFTPKSVKERKKKVDPEMEKVLEELGKRAAEQGVVQSTAPVTKPIDQMSDEEFREWMKMQKAKELLDQSLQAPKGVPGTIRG